MLDGRGHANCQLVQPSGDMLYRAWMLFISFQAHAKWKPVPEIWCWQANTFRWSSVCNIICIKLQKLRVVWLLNRYLTIWYCSPLLIYLPDNTAPSGSTPLRVKSVAMAIATNVLVLALVVIFVWPSMCIWEFTLLSQDPFWNVEASLTVSTTLTSHLSSCLMSRTIMEVEGEGTGSEAIGSSADLLYLCAGCRYPKHVRTAECCGFQDDQCSPRQTFPGRVRDPHAQPQTLSWLSNYDT